MSADAEKPMRVTGVLFRSDNAAIAQAAVDALRTAGYTDVHVEGMNVVGTMVVTDADVRASILNGQRGGYSVGCKVEAIDP